MNNNMFDSIHMAINTNFNQMNSNYTWLHLVISDHFIIENNEHRGIWTLIYLYSFMPNATITT